jgi:hypothetical protein
MGLKMLKSRWYFSSNPGSAQVVEVDARSINIAGSLVDRIAALLFCRSPATVLDDRDIRGHRRTKIPVYRCS